MMYHRCSMIYLQQKKEEVKKEATIMFQAPLALSLRPSLLSFPGTHPSTHPHIPHPIDPSLSHSSIQPSFLVCRFPFAPPTTHHPF